MNQPILVPVSVGELIDKQTILQIKRERIADAAKLQHVEHELTLLGQQAQAFLASCAQRAEIEQLAEQLHAVNAALWDLENEVRALDRAECFDERFVAANPLETAGAHTIFSGTRGHGGRAVTNGSRRFPRLVRRRPSRARRRRADHGYDQRDEEIGNSVPERHRSVGCKRDARRLAVR